MDIPYAINLTNFVSTPQGVAVREGNRRWATGITGYVKSLMAYNAVPPATDKLYAAAGSTIYDVTTGGAATVALTGLLEDNWSHTNFTGTAGHYLVMCNGTDAPRHYNGTSWVTWVYNASPATPGQIAGISDPSRFESVTVHQRRLWFVEKNSTVGWYLPINSIGGTAVSFDFGSLFPRGGRLVSLASWSMNGGTGMQNYLVAVSSEGDVVIYEGTDPSNSTLWTLKGTWRLGAPVSNRCFMQFGGDVLLLCQDGLLPLSKNLQATTTEAALTDAIRPTISSLTLSQAGLDGWQVQDYLARNLLILNVPQINPENNVQFIYNTITGGWSVFTGWPAQCWATFGDQVYFGGNGYVQQAFIGYKDNCDLDGSGGDVYTAFAQQAFSYFEKPGVKKRFVRAKPNFITQTGAPNIRIGCNVDWYVRAPEDLSSAAYTPYDIWGNGVWGVALWSSGGLTNHNVWQTLGAIGYSGALVIAVSVLSETLWLSTEWEMEPGGSR